MKIDVSAKNKDREKYGRYSEIITRVVVTLYVIITTVYNYIFYPGTNDWVVRIIAGSILITVVFLLLHFKARGKLSRFFAALMAPSFFMITNVVVTYIVGRDSLFFWFLLGCSMICYSFLEKKALLLYIIISDIMIIALMVAFDGSFLGPQYSVTHQMTQFISYNLISILIYSACAFSIGWVKKYDSTMETFITLMETTPGYTLITNEQKRVKFISRSLSERLGLSQINEALDRPVMELFHSEEALIALEEVMKTGVEAETNFEFMEDGKKYWFLLQSSPIGGTIARTTELTDITLIMEAKNEAENATRAKTKFLATMSHEIRTPMNAIIGISDIELENENHPPETIDSFDRINNSGRTLLGIINDILDLSKIETGKLELVPVKYETASLIRDTVRLNMMRIGSEPITFELKVADTLPSVLIGDELRIKQILNNLLSNAIKYTERGTVTLEVDSKMDSSSVMLIFTIRDTGQGMTQEQLKELYDEYSQFNQEANRAKEGTGLGMSITQNLVQMMNGKILAESEPGVGSTFTVHLSQQPADGSVIGRELAEDLQNLKLSGKAQRAKIIREYMPYGSVLIVDDVEANLFVARGLMKPYSLKIETAESGYEALEKIKTGTVYDIIFMDHMMPGMDGIETTKLLREAGYTRPIIALTANAVMGLAELFLENGFDDFISKPIDTRQLNFILNKQIRDKKPPEVIEEARRQKSGGNANPAPVIDASSDFLMSLKSIDGLDVDSALDAMSGLPNVYMDTVKLTARRLPELIGKMDEYIANADIKSFRVSVHGLKTVLKNIGAAVLGNIAARLEHAAQEENDSYCDEEYPAFRDGLLRLTEQLNAALPENPDEAKESADKSSLVQVLSEIKAAAEDYDSGLALEILSPCLEFSYGGETDGLLKEIVLALEAFDCDGAAQKIIEIEEKLNGTV